MSDLQKFIRQFLFDASWTKCCDISSLSLSKVQQIDSSFRHIDVKSKISILFTISNSKQSTNDQIAIASQNIIDQALEDDNKFVKSIAKILSEKATKNVLNTDLRENNEVFENNMTKLTRFTDDIGEELGNSFLSQFLQKSTADNQTQNPAFQFRGKSKAKSLRDSYLDKIEEDCAKRRVHVPIPGKGFHKTESEAHITKPQKPQTFPVSRTPVDNISTKKIPEPLRDLSFSETNRLKTFHSRSQIGSSKPGIKLLDFDDLPAQGPKAKQLKKEQMEKERENRKREKEEKSKALKAAREAAKLAKLSEPSEQQRKHMINPSGRPMGDLDKLRMDSLINASMFKASQMQQEAAAADEEHLEADISQPDVQQHTSEDRTAMLRQQLIDSAQDDDEMSSNDLLCTNYQAPPSVLPANPNSSGGGGAFSSFAKPSDVSVMDDSDDEEDDMALLPPTPAFNPSHHSEMPEYSPIKQNPMFVGHKTHENNAEQSRLSEETANSSSNMEQPQLYHQANHPQSINSISNQQQYINLSESKNTTLQPCVKNPGGQMIYLVTSPNQLAQSNAQIHSNKLHQTNPISSSPSNLSTNNNQNNQKILIALKPEQMKNFSPNITTNQAQFQSPPLTAGQGRFVQIRPNANIQQQSNLLPLNLKSGQISRPQFISPPGNSKTLKSNFLSPTEKTFRTPNQILLSPGKLSNLQQTAFTIVNPSSDSSPQQGQHQQPQQLRILSPKGIGMGGEKTLTLTSPPGTSGGGGQIFVINTSMASGQPSQQQHQQGFAQPNIFQFSLSQQPQQQKMHNIQPKPAMISTSNLKLVQAPNTFSGKLLSPPPDHNSSQQVISSNQSVISVQDDLSLTKQQFAKLEAILEDANRVSRPEIAMIISFLAGKDQDQGMKMQTLEILLGEYRERVFDRNSGEMIEMAAQTLVHLDYAKRSLEKIKRYQKVDPAILEKLPLKMTPVPASTSLGTNPSSSSPSTTTPNTDIR